MLTEHHFTYFSVKIFRKVWQNIETFCTKFSISDALTNLCFVKNLKILLWMKTSPLKFLFYFYRIKIKVFSGFWRIYFNSFIPGLIQNEITCSY